MNVIEISTDNKYLSIFRGFLRISEDKNILSDLPLDSILAVIITGHQVTYSNNILVEFAVRNISLIICGKNYHPIGIFSAIEGNCRQTEVMLKQIEVSEPFLKNLWKIIVIQKIRNQAAVLNKLNLKSNDIEMLAQTVKSGDTENNEAVAARAYFPRLFGEGFIRNADIGKINGFLNYGYAIMRAALARYVIAAGLLPSFGIHHRNMLNSFCLVDDLIEPYRPIVDNAVRGIFKNGSDENIELKPEYKKILSGLLDKVIQTKEGISPLNICMQRTVWSLADSYKKKEVLIEYEKHLI
jgi:CRISPR-associated protein Cas1